MVVRLSRPADGRVMCAICFDYRWPDELFTDSGGEKWDICADGYGEHCAHQAGLQ